MGFTAAGIGSLLATGSFAEASVQQRIRGVDEAVNYPDWPAVDKYPAKKSTIFTEELTGREITSENVTLAYNNFYEFRTDKANVWRHVERFETRPWEVEVGGLVSNPQTFDVDDLIRSMPLEERDSVAPPADDRCGGAAVVPVAVPRGTYYRRGDERLVFVGHRCLRQTDAKAERCSHSINNPLEIRIQTAQVDRFDRIYGRAAENVVEHGYSIGIWFLGQHQPRGRTPAMVTGNRTSYSQQSEGPDTSVQWLC